MTSDLDELARELRELGLVDDALAPEQLEAVARSRAGRRPAPTPRRIGPAVTVALNRTNARRGW